MRDLGIAIGSVMIALFAVLMVLACAGYSPGAVLTTWSAGAFGSTARIAASLQEAAPLLWCGLAAAIAFRAGALNIGVEGQFALGAVFAAGFATSWQVPGPAWLATTMALAAGAAAGALWAALALALERGRGVPLVLSTILLNLIAFGFASMLVERVFHDAATTAPQTAVIARDLRLPVWLVGVRLHIGAVAMETGVVAMHIGVVAAGLATVGLWLVQTRTALGFGWTVAGLNPLAGRIAGLPIERRRMQAMVLSGTLGGIAGACQVLGVTHVLSAGSSTSGSGYGFAGIAVALLGRLHPLGVLAAALFFGALDTGARQLERRLEIPHDLGEVVKGLVVAGVLVGVGIAAVLAARRGRADGKSDDA